jgi:hypothetical protein
MTFNWQKKSHAYFIYTYIYQIVYNMKNVDKNAIIEESTWKVHDKMSSLWFS